MPDQLNEQANPAGILNMQDGGAALDMYWVLGEGYFNSIILSQLLLRNNGCYGKEELMQLSTLLHVIILIGQERKGYCFIHTTLKTQ